MVDEVGVDGVLEVSTAEVGEENVDCFLGAIVFRVAANSGGAAGGVGCDGVVDGFDDVGVGEEFVGFDFLHSALDGFLAEGAWGGQLGSALGVYAMLGGLTADLFEGVELPGIVLYEVDI